MKYVKKLYFRLFKVITTMGKNKCDCKCNCKNKKLIIIPKTYTEDRATYPYGIHIPEKTWLNRLFD